METKQKKKNNSGLSTKWILIGAVAIAVIAVVFVFKNKVGTQDPNDFQSVVKAAEKGDPEAQNCLGLCYYTGKGVKQDHKKAVELFTKAAADKKCVAAINNLATCYYEGKGTERNDKKAFELFLTAANHKYVPALFNVAACYETGRGVEKDVKKAVEYYQKAADAGMPAAREKLKKLNKK